MSAVYARFILINEAGKSSKTVQVVFYVCMGAQMDSALHDAVWQQEIRAALESVFPFSLLAQFLTAPRSEKELQLNELPYIVAGICLFNQSTGAAQAGACTEALQQHATNPQNTLQECLDMLESVRRTLLCCPGVVRSGMYHGMLCGLISSNYPPMIIPCWAMYVCFT